MSTPYELAPIKEVLGEDDFHVNNFLANSMFNIEELLIDAFKVRKYSKESSLSWAAKKKILEIAECYEQQARRIAKTFDSFYNERNKYMDKIDELFKQYNATRGYC